jgi:CDP-paratose 2-epimerase
MSALLPRGRTLITGGAGFIGANLAHRLLERGERVILLDNLSRPSVERNVSWLRDRYGTKVDLVIADVRDSEAVRSAARGVDHVFHFAAQVAVTTSLTSPVDDFAVNARGTLNVLEAIRTQAHPPSLLFTSTNKVYGALEDVGVATHRDRYEAESSSVRGVGVSEQRPLDFHSPYGCSKGTADQYVLDYARSFGLRTAVFRMSCIYGPRQFGTEDQGWVAHFILRALQGEAITIYGDGRQVRDLLFVGDLVDAFERARANMDVIAGHAFNIGGGPTNTVSLLELLTMIEVLHGRRPRTTFAPSRTGDQRYYVSDVRKFAATTGWRPRVVVREGVRRLDAWLRESLAQSALPARGRRMEVRP